MRGSALPWRDHDLRLNHESAQPAIAARNARLPHHGAAAAVQRRAFGPGDIADRNAGEKIGLAFDGRGAAAFGQIGDGGSSAEIVGQRHNCAAMKRAKAVVQFLADRKLGDDFVTRNMRHLHADQGGERRLDLCFRIYDKVHNCPLRKLLFATLIPERDTNRHPRRAAAGVCNQLKLDDSSARLWHDAHVGFHRLPPIRIKLLRLVVGYRASEDDVFTLFPVRRRRDAMLGSELQRVDDPQHFIEIAARRHRIDENKLDLLVRANHEHIAYRLVVGWRAAFRAAARARRQHAVKFGDFQIGVADQWIIGSDSDDVLDISGPFLVTVDRVDGQTQDLDATLVEFRLKTRHRAELGGANRGEIFWMRKQHRPIVTDPVVEANFAFCGFGLEIWGGVINLQSHKYLPLGCVLGLKPYVRRSRGECQPCSRSFALNIICSPEARTLQCADNWPKSATTRSNSFSARSYSAN